MNSMIVRLIKKSKIINFNLPTTIKGNYWITDTDYLGNIRNLINVEECDGKWKIKSDFETKIMAGSREIESAFLSEYSMFFLKINTDNEYVILYCSPNSDKQIVTLITSDNTEYIIGNDPKANISYLNPLVSPQHAKLIIQNGKWSILDLNSKYGTYVNNTAITQQSLEYGDIIFIMGLRIIVMKNTIVINMIGNYVGYDESVFRKQLPTVQKQVEQDNPDEEQIEFYKEDDYFYRAPRFKTKIEDVNITIDPPPGKEAEDETPAILSVGPMLTMGMVSGSTAFTTLNNVLNGSVDLESAYPSLIMSGGMLASMLLWPFISKRYQKAQHKKKEAIRQNKYTSYIEEKRAKIQSEMKIQRQILIDNYLPISATKEILYQKKRNLWEREMDQDDFLDLRLGIGSTNLSGEIKYPQSHFEIETDNLLEQVYKLGSESTMLENVPISLSFLRNRISAIIGSANIKDQFLDGLLLQMLTYHSYEDLKIVVMTDEKNVNHWKYLKIAPHCWNNEKTIRYFATNLDEAKELSLALEQDIQARKNKENNGKIETNTLDYHHYKPYYVIITDNYKMYRDIELIKDVEKMEINYGFSLIVVSPRLINIPNECKTFISVGDKKSGIFENELVSNKQKEFTADFDPTLNMYECCRILANIPIDIAKQNQNLPLTLSFLEMYNVGMIEQLNIQNRWKTNDPTKSLQAPVGLDRQHELFKLDLHEKFHGPHGLVAGMTGSGKSEFIVTYIISMAINYHPYEVSFVLIDYKGGGLAGVFQNKETGMKLPHLAGTITNLDTVEMNRSLASIQSELRKRQRMFNEARDKLNESTIDIYKYQGLYRKGLVSQPISHLFIISDEFAELKAQRPEFMDQLISTARIGRSLGVHLILATQKPNGVVNDQIWSNTKFRVCLKVQDKSDSMDMIKVPDAASLKNPGRFYLQVGYNELFAMGQAAWAGAQYYPTEKRKKKVDQSIDILDNVGNKIKSLDTKSNDIVVESQGEEITNVVKYIVNEAKSANIQIDQLWLDSIPAEIFVDKLRKKYNYKIEKNNINPIIGEYDDPDNQRQEVLTLPLSKQGNTIVYGSAGSGKELMLSSIVYSSITTHDSSEVNFYIIDCGAETLTVFKQAPHVGEVLLANESEKIENLFKMILTTIETRKKLFVDYNGSYDFYINHGGTQMPLMVIMINNGEAFFENFPDYEDAISQLTRDCLKYGVIFIISTNGPNTLRYKVRQNFSQNVVLQFNDPSDYVSVIPGVRKKEPSKIYGRGMMLLDNIYEFQTAYPYQQDQMTDYIKVVCSKLKQICTYQAKNIPVLPETVTLEHVEEALGKTSTLPVGIEKESLEVSTINLNDNIMFNITGDDITAEPDFLDGLVHAINEIPAVKSFVLDVQSVLEEYNYTNLQNTRYQDGDVSEALEELAQAINAGIDAGTNNPIIITMIGPLQFQQKAQDEQKTQFNSIIDVAKQCDNIRFIIVETINNIKTISFDPWYKNNSDLSEAIWIGNGIANQFTIKVTTAAKLLRAEVEPVFGYNIHKGKASLIKFITGKERS